MKPCAECAGMYRRPDQDDTRLCARCWEREGQRAAWREQEAEHRKRVSGSRVEDQAAEKPVAEAQPNPRRELVTKERQQRPGHSGRIVVDPDTPHCPVHPLEPKWECRGCQSAYELHIEEEVARSYDL